MASCEIFILECLQWRMVAATTHDFAQVLIESGVRVAGDSLLVGTIDIIQAPLRAADAVHAASVAMRALCSPPCPLPIVHHCMLKSASSLTQTPCHTPSACSFSSSIPVVQLWHSQEPAVCRKPDDALLVGSFPFCVQLGTSDVDVDRLDEKLKEFVLYFSDISAREMEFLEVPHSPPPPPLPPPSTTFPSCI